MSEQPKSDAKVQKPSTFFDEPIEVVMDSSLTKAQKVESLDTLEQDARQMAEASSEGMGGGERNKLHEVLIAEDMLASSPAARHQPGDLNLEAGHSAEWNFDGDPAGGLPAGAEVFSGRWQVRAEDDAPSKPNVLCQTATAEFPAVCLSEKVYDDFVASVQFKAASGQEDQAAGILFRVQDKDNYYILRANALEDNVNFYIFASGKRSSLKGNSVKVASGQWQELRVEATGNRFRGFLNGQLVVEASDDNYPAGKVGLWTKADSVTCFDNVQVTAR